MGPKTSGTTGADFQKRIDQLFELEEEPLKEEEEEEADEGNKNPEDA